ncbi:50S ribosomal protein L22 [Flammeovirga pacifica]|uniref:Large ribosomal subunit protein uL22 n=1 Tax=Flammeovirga pacifica TaxID=915059 RepID=A0A1S1Z3G0_FLAPC|nr:50S ribosomal protein L22 [Flammeovirga pacifica]OHX67781.1 50S ribosomal protein L22 [Flammeovirga pacifica]
MEAVAKLNNCPIAPRKMMLVADAVRGAQVIDALNTLRYAQKAGAPLVEKLILSAVANWEAKNPDESVEDADLYVKTIFVTGGRQLKRFRPAPQGRAHRIRKRSNHVTLVVDARNTTLIDVVAEDTESNESDN